MYYFDSNLVKYATELLKEYKNLSEAARDVEYLENIICSPYHYYFDSNWLLQIDQQMRKKYPAIDAMQALADAVNWIKLPIGQQSYNVSTAEIERLKFDRFGIMAHALKSVKKVVDYAEFFDKSKIVNSDQ